MTDRYFNKFPSIYYNGSLCTDISRRVSIDDNINIQGSLDIFYPYEITNYLRPDHIAEFYYNDSEQDWLIFLTNKIIDPYYGWYLDQQQFLSLIDQKYQSFENANRTIKYYQNNWADDQQPEISVSFYNNNLDKKWRKYYEPVWGPRKKILSYIRKQDDSVVNTNRIVSYTVNTASFTSNASFVVGEPVDFKIVQSVVGQGQVSAVNSTTIMISSVSGDFVTNTANPKIITGTLSFANCATTGNSVTVIENLSLDEEVFWSPVTMFDYEVNENEQRKNIYLIGSGYQSLVSQQIANTLSQNVDTLTGLVIS